jgi:hypothetical protein
LPLLAAALEGRTITLDQRFGCGKRVVDGEIFRDASEAPCETLDAAGVIATSSNVGCRTSSIRSDRHASRRGS